MNDNWNAGDTAIAICNIYLFIKDKSGKESEKKLITKGRNYLVKDVQTIKCMDTLDVGISRTLSEVICYDCKSCKESHIVKTNKDFNIYFPSFWFKKPEKNTLKEKIKRVFKWKKKEDDSDKFLVPKSTPSKIRPPREIPKKFHEKERSKETVEGII